MMSEANDSGPSGSTCPNCSNRLPAGASYCPECGQSQREFARPWLTAIREVADELFDIDGRMLRTLHALLLRPGLLTRDFLDGRRARYTPPLRLYLVISLLFFLVLPAAMKELTASMPGHSVSTEMYSRAMFVLLPLFALLLKLFYHRVYYLSHLVFSLHLFSALYIALAPMLALERRADDSALFIALQALLLTYMLSYVLIAMRTSYRDSWPRTILKTLGLLLVFLPILGLAIDVASHDAEFQPG